jgi:hypothetical protein
MNQNTVWLILSAAGLVAFAVYWLMKRRKLRQSRSWPSAEGRVNSTDLSLHKTGTEQSQWFATVLYSYSVQGASYSGKLQRTYLLKGHGEKWLGGFPAGLVLAVRYNPAKPADSVLHEDEQSAASASRPS